MKYILQTERLSVRELVLSDSPFILQLLNSAGWLRFIGDRNIKTEEGAKKYLEEGPIRSYGENGYGLWLVESREDARPMGMCGLLKRDNLDQPDLGFAFLPEFGGKGYAFEVAAAAFQYARATLGIPAVYAITLTENERSIKLLQKIGMKYIRPFKLPDTQTELLLFSS
ncbi:acetyltransferase [Flammeovirgaceae bacterium 311]|nr:acetyltransferase [Flammeovirgaceae bacterium 311]